jgi:hypothetical protein
MCVRPQSPLFETNTVQKLASLRGLVVGLVPRSGGISNFVGANVKEMLCALLSRPRGTTHVLSGRRSHDPTCFGGGPQPQLSDEEYKALAGVWRCCIEMDCAPLAMSLHLAVPELAQRGSGSPAGRIHALDDTTCMQCPDAWTTARWSASREVWAGEAGDILSISLSLGCLRLEGQGRRVGLRCPEFAGTVLDGGVGGGAPRLGTFSMALLLPIKTDSAALETRYQERIADHAPFAGDVSALFDGEDIDALLDELMDACDAGDDVACEMVSKEEEAKRAWLASLELDAPGPTSWQRGGQERGLSKEEEAKRAWLASLVAPGPASWQRR